MNKNELFTEELYNDLIFYFITTLTKSEIDKKVTEVYTKAFAELVHFLNINKIVIRKSIIDYVVMFGKYDSSDNNHVQKRFCVFFCSQLLQIEINPHEDLTNSFLSLYKGTDRSVKLELAYQLRFVAKVKDQSFYDKHLAIIINSYIEDSEIKIQVEAIISILENYEKVCDDDSFNNKIIGIIIRLLTSDRMEKIEYVKKVTKMVQAIMRVAQNNFLMAQILERVVNLIFNVYINLNIIDRILSSHLMRKLKRSTSAFI